MTRSELKMSELSAEVTLADKGLTREQVMRLTGRQPRPAIIIEPPEEPKPEPEPMPDRPQVPTPMTQPERHAAAVKAVDLVKGGMSARQALWSVGLSQSYATGISVCLKESSPYHDAARAGTTMGERKASHVLSFVRWFLNCPPVNGIDSPENQRLRKALLSTTIPLPRLAEKAGCHVTSLYSFRSGTVTRMREGFRARVWAALDPSQN